jgi:hypothetical protein
MNGLDMTLVPVVSSGQVPLMQLLPAGWLLGMQSLMP